MSSIHNVLNQADWDITEMRSLLEKDASSINSFNKSGIAPLHRVLQDQRCSVEIVELFLHHGANPNLEINSRGNRYCALAISLLYNRITAVIRLLLYKGAHVNSINNHSLLCMALCNYPNDSELIQILLDAGAYPKDCRIHHSVFYCVKPNSKLSLDVCKLLLKMDKSVITKVDHLSNRSLLCFSLAWNTEPGTIEFLLEAGCSLDACQKHHSALECACSGDGPLKKGTLQILLNAGSKNDCTPRTSPLNLALENRSYDADAIKFLYEHEGENDDYNYKYLHSAAKNVNCKTSIVQFLITQGMEMGPDGNRLTPLIYALENTNCQPGVIQLLADNDYNINTSYDCRPTALKVALDKDKNMEIIQMLLKAGSRLNAGDKIKTILQNALDKYDSNPSQEHLNFFRVLLKYAYLEDPKFKIKDLFRGRKHYRTFSQFEDECAEEIRLLKSKRIFEFVSRYSDYKPKAKGDQLLKVPSTNNFVVYFDVICSTFGKNKAIDMRLQVQPIFFFKFNSEGGQRKVILNYEIILKIVSFLKEEDKFSLLLAMYESDRNKSNSLLQESRGHKRKISFGIPTERRKSLRLQL